MLINSENVVWNTVSLRQMSLVYFTSLQHIKVEEFNFL